MNESQTLLDSFLSEYAALAPIKESIAGASQMLIDCFAGGGKLLICGNGGSAADSEHIVGELMKGFERKRELTAAQKERFPDTREGAFLAGGLQNALPAISLVSQSALISAIGNDNGASLVFAQQVWGYGKEGDVLLALSTSGHSENVVLAAQTAQAKGLKILAITGKKDSRLSRLADLTLFLPAETPRAVQELTLPVYHFLCRAAEDAFFS